MYKGVLENATEVAVLKCVNHDSKQGLRGFKDEISSIGRLKHKNLVSTRSWCRKTTNKLMLQKFEFPNG